MRYVLIAVALAASACSSALPTAPSSATLPPLATPAPSELHAYAVPVFVFPGGDTQIHVGTFAADANGARIAVPTACTFTTDAGIVQPAQAVDPGWQVAILSVAPELADREIHVRAQCDALSTTVAVQVAPPGTHATPGPTPCGIPGGPGCPTGPVTGTPTTPSPVVTPH